MFLNVPYFVLHVQGKSHTASDKIMMNYPTNDNFPLQYIVGAICKHTQPHKLKTLLLAPLSIEYNTPLLNTPYDTSLSVVVIKRPA